jgi:transposase
LVTSAKLLDDAYRTEKNVDVRERLLLVRRVMVDNEQAAIVAENEFYRSRWWAYKWLKRFAESGLEGLKDLPRTGRPPEVSEEKFAEIRRELSENLTSCNRNNNPRIWPYRYSWGLVQNLHFKFPSLLPRRKIVLRHYL